MVLDISMAMLRVYNAGKVSKNGKVPGRIYGHVDESGSDADAPYEHAKEGYISVGPVTYSCDHGCFHGDAAHGCGANGKECVDGSEYITRERVLERCMTQIDAADVVVAHFGTDEPSKDAVTSYGTLVEVGVAAANGKPIVVVFEDGVPLRVQHDLWFPAMLSLRSLAKLDLATKRRIFKIPFIQCVYASYDAYVHTMQPLKKWWAPEFSAEEMEDDVEERPVEAHALAPPAA